MITAVKLGATRFGTPYAFINFGDYKLRCFTLVLWAGALAEFKKARIDVEVLVGSWVSVIGLIQTYKGSPQIVIERPSEVMVLANQKAAQAILDAPTTIGAQVPLSKNEQLRTIFSQLESGQQIPTAIGTTTNQGVGGTAKTSAPSQPTQTQGPHTSRNRQIGTILEKVIAEPPAGTSTPTGSQNQSAPMQPAQQARPNPVLPNPTKPVVPLPPAPLTPLRSPKRDLRYLWLAIGLILVCVLFAIF